MIRHALLLFLALRASDVITILGALYFVPKYATAEELGAILPATSFATFLALPLFAFAMTVMKEASQLAAESRRGELKALLRGAFAAGAATLVLLLALAATLVPAFLAKMEIADSAVGFFVLAAAFLGCVAPVFTDQLQSTRRFAALGAIEIGAALLRLLVLVVTMPFRAFAGFFAGNTTVPVIRIAGAILALRAELRVPAKPFWTRTAVRRIAIAFLAVLVYQFATMGVALYEQTALRTLLPTVDSACYFMLTRLSDLLNYLTLPLILVLFPYTATIARRGETTTVLVRKSIAIAFGAATVLSLVYALWGETLMSLIPHGEEYAQFTPLLPLLVLIGVLTAGQVFYTNTEVSAGRFGFLRWLVSLNLAELAVLHWLGPRLGSLTGFLTVFLAFAALRFGCCYHALRRQAPA